MKRVWSQGLSARLSMIGVFVCDWLVFETRGIQADLGKHIVYVRRSSALSSGLNWLCDSQAMLIRRHGVNNASLESNLVGLRLHP